MTLDRLLILHFEGAPLCWGATQGDIRTRILEHADDDVDLFAVWSVPGAQRLSMPRDITEQFACDWAKEFKFGLGIEPHDYLAPFPAFVRHFARTVLIGKWQSELAVVDAAFIPDALRRAS